MKITYKFADGATSIVEVSEDIGNVIIDFERLESNSDRKHRYNDCSLDAYDVDGNFVPSDEDIVGDFLEKEERELLYKAIRSLLPEQQDLIIRIYFNNEKMCDIATECGVSKAAITQRVNRALAQLKKIIENFS